MAEWATELSRRAWSKVREVRAADILADTNVYCEREEHDENVVHFFTGLRGGFYSQWKLKSS